jgi:hypothetical protein
MRHLLASLAVGTGVTIPVTLVLRTWADVNMDMFGLLDPSATLATAAAGLLSGLGAGLATWLILRRVASPAPALKRVKSDRLA